MLRLRPADTLKRLSRFNLHFEDLKKPKFRVRVDPTSIWQDLNNAIIFIGQFVRELVQKGSEKIRQNSPRLRAGIILLYRYLDKQLNKPLTLKHIIALGLILYAIWPSNRVIGVQQPIQIKVPQIVSKLPQTQKQPQTEAALATIKPEVVTTQVTDPSITNCGDNIYKQFIYKHESGCNTGSVNAGGCRGLGQACPGSKLPCGNDFACQDAYFSQYAQSRYGGWPQAYQAWLAQGWW